MADPAGTVEAVEVRVDEGIEARDGRRFLRPSPAVCGEECFQSSAVHWTKSAAAILALMDVIDNILSVRIPDMREIARMLCAFCMVCALGLRPRLWGVVRAAFPVCARWLGETGPVCSPVARSPLPVYGPSPSHGTSRGDGDDGLVVRTIWRCAWVEAPSEAAAVRRSLGLDPLGDWTGDARQLLVFPQDAYPEHAGPHDDGAARGRTVDTLTWRVDREPGPTDPSAPDSTV